MIITIEMDRYFFTPSHMDHKSEFVGGTKFHKESIATGNSLTAYRVQHTVCSIIFGWFSN